jgi:hypothetical protein
LSKELLLTILLVIEMVSGIIALLVTPVAFTSLSWGEGASSGAMKRESLARAKRLFWVAGALWAICILSFLAMRFGGPIIPIATSNGGPPGGMS